MKKKVGPGINNQAPELSVIGKPVSRVDTLQKASGKALYTGDLKLAGMLYGKALRSPFPHARIREIDVSGAYSVPGVKAVVTGKDFPHRQGLFIRDEPFLALDRVRYIGEAVAAVAAGSEEEAQKGAEKIRVLYDPLPAVFDPVEAVKPAAPLVHDDPASYPHSDPCRPVPRSNICSYFKLRKGDVERAFKEADYIVEDTYKTSWNQHCALEPHAAIAAFDSSGKVTLWTGNDGPHRCRKEIALALGISLSSVRVISSFQGGGFGSKGGLRAEAVAVALASKVKPCPVKVTYAREEVFTSTLLRHPVLIHSKAGVKKNGQIIAKKVELYWNTGAYGEKGPWVCKNASMTASGPYHIPNVWIDGYCVYTNSPIAGPMRGFGVPQVTFAYESQVDEIADRLKIDPLELRLRHVLDENVEAAWGERIRSIGLKDCLKRAAQGVGWGRPSEGKNRGKGIACMQKFSGTPPGVTNAIVRFNHDGSLDILTSSMEIGQGVMTILSQIASEELGVPMERIRVSLADTSYTPFDPSTIGSRTTYHMGNAVILACREIKKQLLSIASKVLTIPKRELICDGGTVSGKKGEAISFQDLLTRFPGGEAGGGGGLSGKGSFYTRRGTGLDPETGQGKRPAAFWMYGAQAVEVEVDRETGRVNILKLATAHDVGKVINPLNCEQQMQGAIAMGVGNALFEKMEVREGQILNPSFESYRMPTSCDLPQNIETLFVEKSHPEGPFGAKGMAEPAAAPTAGAIGNAVFAATGVRIREVPLTPEKVYDALEEVSRGKIE
jgi:CO/xanthine dehydrogenase Mo-binding subunit